MKTLSITALAVFALGGCQATAAVGPAIQARTGLPAGRGQPFDFGGDCQPAVLGFKSKGGKTIFPALRYANYNFNGHAYYSAYQGRDQDVSVVACPGSDNGFNLPVPPGYTADWFEQLHLPSSPLTFENADLFGEMYSTTWVPKMSYMLYAYDDQNNLLQSSEMGPLKKKKSLLKFVSPFENGLTVPADGFLYLEIAHPTQ